MIPTWICAQAVFRGLWEIMALKPDKDEVKGNTTEKESGRFKSFKMAKRRGG
jgi:hypothetical protein